MKITAKLVSDLSYSQAIYEKAGLVLNSLPDLHKKPFFVFLSISTKLQPSTQSAINMICRALDRIVVLPTVPLDSLSPRLVYAHHIPSTKESFTIHIDYFEKLKDSIQKFERNLNNEK